MALTPAAPQALTPAGDSRTFIERRGRGPAVLLVHGLGGPAMWERVAPILSASLEILLPHLPGFGESPPAGRRLTADDHALHLGRLLDDAGIGQVTVAGISYGGEVAALLAAARPDLVRGLVLVCPTGTRSFPPILNSAIFVRLVRPVLRYALTRPLISEALSRRAFYNRAARPGDLVERHLARLRLPGRADALVDAIGDIWSRGGNLPGIVGGLRVPVRLVWGADDRTIPARATRLLVAARPETGTTIIAQCGHSVPLEKPVELASVIAEAAAPTPRPP